jgi:hypothetical protein
MFGEPGVVLSTHRQPQVRLTLSAPQRPCRDAVWDYLVSISGEGLQAEAVVTSLGGDALGAYLGDLAERFRGWPGVREWQSLEGQFRVEATWWNRGHVMLRVHLRHHSSAWEASAEFKVDAGAQLEALSAEVVEFFAARD